MWTEAVRDFGAANNSIVPILNFSRVASTTFILKEFPELYGGTLGCIRTAQCPAPAIVVMFQLGERVSRWRAHLLREYNLSVRLNEETQVLGK